MTLAGGAIWWQPIFLMELFAERERLPVAKAATEYCARYSQPATGGLTVYDSDDRVAPLTIKTSAGGGYYVKLEKLISGHAAMTFFVRGGETLQARVPEGSFVLKYAMGDRWCGEVNLFGPSTTTKRADQTFIFEEGRGYTVTLIARKDGNLRTTTISRDQF